MRAAHTVYFPTLRFVWVFQAIDKPTFPSPATYLYRRSRLHQQILFKVFGIPHGKTRIYFGRRQKGRIRQDFRPPVEIMEQTTRAGSIHFAADWDDVDRLLGAFNPVIVREARPAQECIRLICIGASCIGAERYAYAEGRLTRLEPVPPQDPSLPPLVLEAERLARSVGLDDIALDWVRVENDWELLQLARPPLHIDLSGRTLSRYRYIAELIEKGVL